MPPSWRAWARLRFGAATPETSVRRHCRRLRRAPRQLLPVKGKEVDVVERQRREPAVAGHVGDDPAHEGEQHARTFDEQEWVQLILWHALYRKDTGVIQFQQEQRLVVGFVTRGDLELGYHFIVVGRPALAGIKTYLHLDVGLHLAVLRTLLGYDILERQIARILREHLHPDLRRLGGPAIRHFSHQNLLKVVWVRDYQVAEPASMPRPAGISMRGILAGRNFLKLRIYDDILRALLIRTARVTCRAHPKGAYLDAP